jgi:hypothetical protein
MKSRKSPKLDPELVAVVDPDNHEKCIKMARVFTRWARQLRCHVQHAGNPIPTKFEAPQRAQIVKIDPMPPGLNLN